MYIGKSNTIFPMMVFDIRDTYERERGWRYNKNFTSNVQHTFTHTDFPSAYILFEVLKI